MINSSDPTVFTCFEGELGYLRRGPAGAPVAVEVSGTGLVC